MKVKNDLYEIEIFLAGTRPAANGMMTTITQEDLQQVVETYNPGYFRAPLLVSENLGHDIGNYTDSTVSKSKELCHGIPKKLKRVGNRLYAQFDKLSKNFAEWVRNKQIHSVSSSFYLPNSPNNPYPGKWSLRHIAGLGSTPPACKGLAPLPEPPSNWSEFSEYPINLEFSEEVGIADFTCGCKTKNYGRKIMGMSPWLTVADLFQNYREYLIEKEDLETADRVLPSDKINELRMMSDLDNAKQQQIFDLQSQISELGMQLSYSKSEDDEDEEYKPYSYEEMKDYKSKMKMAGLTAADAADALGMDEADVESILSGETEPTKEQRKQLDGYLKMAMKNVEMSELLTEKEQELKEREDAVFARERALEYREVSSFVEGLVSEGKVKASKKADTITLILNTPNNSEVEFSDAIGLKTPRQVLMEDLEDRPAWNFNETIVKDEQDPVNPDFSEVPKGTNSQSVQQHQAIVGWCKQHNKDHTKAADYSKAMLALNISY